MDLWVDSSQENAERVVKVLRDFGFPGDDVTTEMITGERDIIRMGFEPTRLELFTRIPGVIFTECFERRIFVRIGSMDVPFIGLEDLKVNKKASGRHKDLQDLEELP